ncbi:DUF2080 family transposase-associated protein [uncultured Methanolobus sp.]|uniref:DUF2080 family transposase-associated protein n=1 Tax=uncultured Methanolobus sp. TaxID=218300 RepID=UPI0029C63EF5|nr:DUF2080 family transposase-associated protein [uncultured Methanolobus sp.]
MAANRLINRYIVTTMEIKTDAYQVIEKTVKSSGNSGRVYVPKEWVGKKVKILLMDPLDTE